MAPGISQVLEHTATKLQRLPLCRTFLGSSFLVAVPPMSWEVDVCYKSKMAVKLPEVLIILLVLQIHMSFQKTIQGCTTMYETSKSQPIMADATSCRKFKMAAN